MKHLLCDNKKANSNKENSKTVSKRKIYKHTMAFTESKGRYMINDNFL